VGRLLNWTVHRSAARARVGELRADTHRDALRSAQDQALKAATITRARQREDDIISLELLDAEQGRRKRSRTRGS